MGRLYILLFYLIIYLNSFSQREADNWYFGQGAGITFNSGSAVAITNGQLNTLEGCSSISDANGNLLFYTDGRRVWNKNHLPMLNTTTIPTYLKGDPSSSQSGIIVPKPGSTTTYYIFTVDMQGGLALLAGDADGVSNGLMYSEVDMTAAAGLGAVVLARKNISLSKPTTEGLSAVKDANGIDYWVVAHGINNNSYLAYHVTATGVNTTPVISNTGPIVIATAGFPNFGAGAAGYMKIAPNGKKIAACHYRENKQIVISDFNTTNGVVSNSISDSINLNSDSEGPYGVEFSNCNEYLYVTEDFTSIRPDLYPYPKESIIWRYNLDTLDIPASKRIFQQIPNELVGALQLAPDGKIYCSKWIRTGTNINNYDYGFGKHLHAINNPRLDSARFIKDAISLGIKSSTSGLPPFIASFFYNSSISASNLVTGDTSIFCFGDSILFKATTSASDSIRWYFNDFSSGINNTSVIKNPTHLFSGGGNYQITLLKYLCGLSDTTKKNITVSYYPVINNISDISVCSGTSVLLDATSIPVTSYLWNTGALTPTITVDSTGRYIVTADNNGCKSKDSMYLRETVSTTASVAISANTTNTICAGENVLFTADPALGLPSAGQSYQWYKNGSILVGDSTNTYSSNSLNNGDIVEVVLTINNAGICVTGSTIVNSTFPMTVKPVPSMDSIPNQTLCFGDNTNTVIFNSNLATSNFTWTNNNTTIGLIASGTGNIPSFAGSNGGLITQTATITVTPEKNGCNGASRIFSYTVNECSLPVELIDFAGKKVDEFVNKLYWSTASEFNSDYFSLEYSQDFEDFTEIYKIKGAENSKQLLNYNYLHYDVPSGINYYRLKQVDYDGQYSYSKLVKINNSSEKYNASIYPNPATDYITIYIKNPNGNSSILIYDALGQIMHNQEINNSKEQKIDLRISHYANGIYYIKITDAQNKTTLPWIKQ